MKYKLKSGNNYVILYDAENIYLFSYDTLIATYTKEKKLILTSKWNYSTTTKKHLNNFINNYTCYNSSELNELIKKEVVKVKHDINKNFYELCCDCLYYGYKWQFIKENYPEFINNLGVENAKNIYNKAFDKICNE